jgi:hypothetical protein
VIAYVHIVPNGSYNITLTDPETNEVLDEIILSGQEEYDAWKQTAINSGTEVEELTSTGLSSEPGPAASSPSSESPTSVPDLPTTEEETRTFKETMEDLNLFYGAGDADLPTEISISSIPESAKIIEEKDQSAPPQRKRDQKTKDNKKSSLDKGDLDKEKKKASQQGNNSGLANSALVEPVPDFKSCQGDVVLNGRNNQWLVFGRDRPGGYKSGYGPGQGDTQAGAIDLVVGRMSPHVNSRNRDGSKIRVSPIFNYDIFKGKQVCDASRIYISQKTDMDSNFNLVPGRIGRPISRAGIILKSDGIRIIARDSGIKLVTHSRQLMNSQGGTSAKAPSGIDIIAGNDDANLQPMVLGDNLVMMLREYGETLNQVIGTVTSLIENVAKLDVALATHFHPQSFPAGVPNLPSPVLAPVCAESLVRLVSLDTFSTFAEKFKLEKINKQYLSSGGVQSIRSTFNNVN